MDRLYNIAFTVPAGTAQAAPAVQAVPLEDAWLEAVRIIVPDGHNGLTGLAVLWGGVGIIPAGGNAFIVANAEVMDVDYRDQITAAGITLAGFNTDIFPHTFYLRFTVTDRPAQPTATIASPQAATQAVADAGAVADLTSGGVSPADLAAADMLSVADVPLEPAPADLALPITVPPIGEST